MEIFNMIKFAFTAYAQTVLYFITSPIVWIFIIVILSQYASVIKMQKNMYGDKTRYKLSDLISTSILSSILAGLVSTIFITVTGITFYKFQGLQIIIILSIMLMMINPRYVCLSYAGGMLSLAVLIVNDLVGHGYISSNNDFVKFISNNMAFDVTALMAIIAIMHLIEALLIMIDGKRGASPVYMKRKDEIVGAFVMQRFWIIPIVFYALTIGNTDLSSSVATPNWWPLLKPPVSNDILKKAMFVAVPLISMLGYGDFAVSSSVGEKVKRSSINLFIFSGILLILTFLSSKYYIFKYIAAFFAPAAHEAIILLERYREGNGDPILKHSNEGVVVLDTIPDGFAEKIGIKTGDMIQKVNNNFVYSTKDVKDIIDSAYTNYFWLDILNTKKEHRVLEGRIDLNNNNGLGIVSIPSVEEIKVFVEEKESKLESKIREKFKI